jgi:hypothetical protein
MDERLSLKAVDDYSEDFSSKLVVSFFAKKETISGPEILKLCSVHQVNLFVIRELLRAWRNEGQKFRSPYFDYHAQEVKDALARFQNVLSNHILISKENFQPLLKKAVSQTLYLIVDPYDFFSDILDRQTGASVRTLDLREDIKYLRINKPPLEKLVQRLEERKTEIIAGKEAFGLLDQILEEVHFTPEDIEGYIKQFSQVVPLVLEKLYEPKPTPPPAIKKPEPSLVSITREANSQPKPVQATKPSLPKQERVSIVDDFQRIENIKDSLTINQKFMFTKILFSGDFEIFSGAIERLDRFSTLDQAMNYIEQAYPEWDKESEEYEEFIGLVSKRYA